MPYLFTLVVLFVTPSLFRPTNLPEFDALADWLGFSVGNRGMKPWQYYIKNYLQTTSKIEKNWKRLENSTETWPSLVHWSFNMHDYYWVDSLHSSPISEEL